METLMPEVIHRESLIKVLVDTYTEIQEGNRGAHHYFPEVIRVQEVLLDDICWDLLGVSIVALNEKYAKKEEEQDG